MPPIKPSSPVAIPRRFHWRRLVQFRLRTVLILTTVVAVWLAWWSHKARQQRAAVASLEKVGGDVSYGSSRPWPKWLVGKFGVDYFASVQSLILQDTKVTNADLEQLQDLTALQALYLNDSRVTDADLEHLKGLTALQILDLNDTKVSDVGLKYLTELTKLRYLELSFTIVSDAGLEHLQSLTALEYLELINTRVTDAGVERLHKALPNCTIVR